MAKTQSIARGELLQALDAGTPLWVVLIGTSEGRSGRLLYATKVGTPQRAQLGLVGLAVPPLTVATPMILTGVAIAVRLDTNTFRVIHEVQVEMNSGPLSRTVLDRGVTLELGTIRVHL